MNMPGTMGSAKLTWIDNMLPKIGILGLGFVGNAIYQSMSDNANLVLVDKNPSKSTHNFNDLFDCEGIFICVPSPSNDDGSCDTSILEEVLDKLKNYKGVIISKTTAPPDVYQVLNRKYPNLVHSPEFLTAANAVGDYMSGKYSIIGGDVKAYMHEADRIIRLGQRNLEMTQLCSVAEAAMAKYVINTFLATKVIFMNEMAELSKKTKIDWNVVRQLIALDQRRVGNSHTQVPGPDGYYGFGGMCFPKDTMALLRFAEKYEVGLNVLDSAVKKNIIIRLTEPK